MKLFNFIFLFSICSILSAQSKDVELIKTENGNETTFHAKSLTRDNMILELNIEGSGFTTSVSLPARVEVKAFEKKEVVKITMGENASYKISYKVMKSSNGGATPMNTAPLADRTALNKGIVVFSKDGCGKCTYAKNTLKDKGKNFTELNISKNEDDQSFMWQKLGEAGFSGGSVQTPVIMIDGKVHFNMDLKLFLADIK